MKCSFCNEEIEWEGHSATNGHIWECEECDKLFCSKCTESAGGSVSEKVVRILCPTCTNKKDLFEVPETLPQEVQDVLEKYCTGDETYENCEKMLQELKPLGYTFEYGLDAVPFNLTKI